ncbi:hypothetical protein VTL71DRAFT_4974 [Oculimacula yallundae]|uniref:Uncharacterized protein n=1 Tax=Oculimacula yallundae TaxID=86028 RepID=A0ABR4C481_9HELO
MDEASRGQMFEYDIGLGNLGFLRLAIDLTLTHGETDMRGNSLRILLNFHFPYVSLSIQCSIPVHHTLLNIIDPIFVKVSTPRFAIQTSKLRLS